MIQIYKIFRSKLALVASLFYCGNTMRMPYETEGRVHWGHPEDSLYQPEPNPFPPSTETDLALNLLSNELDQRETELYEQVRQALLGYSNEVRWMAVLATLNVRGWRYRSVSRAVVTLCMYHDEKTPSLWLRKSGRFYCYGCGQGSDGKDGAAKLLFYQKMRPIGECIKAMGLAVDPDLASQVDSIRAGVKELKDRRLQEARWWEAGTTTLPRDTNGLL